MEKKLKILNDDGIHARPAGTFVKVANEFKSNVLVTSNGVTKNGKSIMSLMGMGLEKDAEIILTVTGVDESRAMEKFEQLINNKFQLSEL